MVVGEIAEPIDLLVVGGGPGGYVAAARAAELGRDVTLVDRLGKDGLGGCCLHVGCIPSKALIELAHALEAATRQPGMLTTGPVIDLAAWQEHKRAVVDGLAKGVESLMQQHGVRVLHGDLRFNKPDRAAVLLPDGNAAFLEFQDVIIATGSRPTVLPNLEPDGERVLDSTQALELTAVPKAVAVVGGGYIGLELGTALAKLGAKVTVVEALDRLLPSMDPALVSPLHRSLKKQGVDVWLGAFARGLDGAALVVEKRDGEHRVPADVVIVAVGRRPNTDDLGLKQLGVEAGSDGLIAVDKRRLVREHVAAIGDVVAGPALAHKASAEGAVAAEALCGRPVVFEPQAIPLIVFTDPQIASTGLTEHQAKEEGMDAITLTSPLTANGRAATLRSREGFAKIVVDRSTDRIVGVHLVGPYASELITEGTLAIEMQASPADLSATIHPHPTLSEAVHDAIERLPAPAVPSRRHR